MVNHLIHKEMLFNIDISKYNYFEILDIEARPVIDKLTLENNYLSLQAKAHPDRFIDEQQKKRVLVISEEINKAYKILKDDFQRRVYLLKLNGVIVNSEDENVKLDTSFLEEIFENRAEIEMMNDIKLLEDRLQFYIKEFVNNIAEYDICFENKKFTEAGIILMKAKYYMKIREEIEKKIGKNNATI